VTAIVTNAAGKPSGAVGVEAGKREGPFVESAQDVASDQIARDDEEDINTDVSARHCVQARMEQDDGDDGEATQALDVWALRATSPSMRALPAFRPRHLSTALGRGAGIAWDARIVC
jgi:hypothetical protein